MISALHKSLRGGDADAAVYWLARMQEGGEKPLYIARRIVRFAGEDFGLADPSRVVQAMACYIYIYLNRERALENDSVVSCCNERMHESVDLYTSSSTVLVNHPSLFPPFLFVPISPGHNCPSITVAMEM